MRTKYIDGVKLPIVNNCDNCGACCFEQGSPPGFLLLAKTGNPVDAEPEDAARWKQAPRRLKKLITDYLERLDNEEATGEGPCVWFDVETRGCMGHRWRPQICRDFEVGCKACHQWRDEYEHVIGKFKDGVSDQQIKEMR